MKRRRLAVLGAGGHGKVVVATALASGDEVLEVYDDRPELWGTEVVGCPVRGPLAEANLDRVDGCVVAVGSNESRKEVVRIRDLPWASVVHPGAWVHESVEIGEGSVVFAGAVIQPDSVLGSHVIVNTGATADHDCRIGNFSHLAPGSSLAGGVVLGVECLIGIGSSVLPGVSIGSSAVVGANAAVIDDVTSGATVTGVPARPLRR